jgi:hypothetical protein
MNRRHDDKPTRRRVNRPRAVPACCRINTEFQSLIPPPSPAEDAALEEALLAQDYREALVVWAEESLLLDGHRRLAIT